MRRIFLHTLLSVLTVSLLGSCVQERPETEYDNCEGEIDVVIPFGSPWGASVDVTTKSALSLADESHVFNLYLMIFAPDDPASPGAMSGYKKVYGHFFDGSE